MEDNIFSKIISKKIPATLVYEDDKCLAFHDINPQAPTHILVIPKESISRIAEAQETHQKLLGHLLLKASQIAQSVGLAETGFRLVINNGADGGESVPHLHVHLLGGRPLAWPPG